MHINAEVRSARTCILSLLRSKLGLDALTAGSCLGSAALFLACRTSNTGASCGVCRRGSRSNIWLEG